MDENIEIRHVATCSPSVCCIRCPIIFRVSTVVVASCIIIGHDNIGVSFVFSLFLLCFTFQKMLNWCNVFVLPDRKLYVTKTRLFKYIKHFTSKNFKNQIKKTTKNSDIFHTSAQNINCGYSLELPQRGGSNEYHNLCFLNRNVKNNAYPCKPQFYYIKVGFKGSKLYRYVFVIMYI